MRVLTLALPLIHVLAARVDQSELLGLRARVAELEVNCACARAVRNGEHRGLDVTDEHAATHGRSAEERAAGEHSTGLHAMDGHALVDTHATAHAHVSLENHTATDSQSEIFGGASHMHTVLGHYDGHAPEAPPLPPLPSPPGRAGSS